MNTNRNLIAPVGAIAAIAFLILSAGFGMTQGSSSSLARTGVDTTQQSSIDVGTVALAAISPLGTCKQAGVPLGEAGDFRVLAGTTVTNTGATVVNGNLGLSPGSSVTGFPPGKVTGKMHVTDKAAAKAQKDLVRGYNNAMGRTNCAKSVAGNIGGKTFGPGLYKSTSSLAISSGDLTLSAHGHSGAVFIFQITSKFTTTSGRHVILAGGARDSNIYWVVGSSATLGTTSVMHGTILAHKSISLATGAKLHGRALAHIGAVTLAGVGISHLPFSGAPSAIHAVPPNIASSFPQSGSFSAIGVLVPRLIPGSPR